MERRSGKRTQETVNSRVFEPVKISKVPNGAKLIDTTWAMNKKSSGTL
jgi:hypothetical protein